MGNTSSNRPTPEELARRKPKSDFENHPSLTPLEPAVKRPLPKFVPLVTVPEGNVHKISRHTVDGFGDAITPSPNDAAEVSASVCQFTC